MIVFEQAWHSPKNKKPEKTYLVDKMIWRYLIIDVVVNFVNEQIAMSIEHFSYLCAT